MLGAPVLGVAAAALASCARADARLLAPKAQSLSFEQACTLPTAWGTAHVALAQASVRCGGRVLLHAGAGGVGLSALAYGHWLRASALATARRARSGLRPRSARSVCVRC